MNRGRWRCCCGARGDLEDNDYIGGTLQMQVCAVCYEKLVESKNALVQENRELVAMLGEARQEMKVVAEQLDHLRSQVTTV
mgnify:FL=1